MSKLRVLDLFSGIGGFSLGLERTGGFETVAFCEIESYPQKVLEKHWPGVPIYDDIRELTAERLAGDGIGVDVITGGFPCQDISVAGKQAGIDEGTRSGLWSELARLIGELRPRYAIMENVTALLSGDRGRWFGRVLGDLAALGYDAEWHCIPASAIGANHRRDRVWIIAYRSSVRVFDMPESGNVSNEKQHSTETKQRRYELASGLTTDSKAQPLANTHSAQCKGGSLSIRIYEEYANSSDCSWWETEPNVGRVANGIPARVDRLKGLGNAVVPQIPELIGNAILEHIVDQHLEYGDQREERQREVML